MTIFRNTVALAGLAALAACADSEPPSVIPEDEFVIARPPAEPLLSEDQPAIGQWTPSLDDERPVLQFGPPNTEPLFSLRCAENGGLLLRRHGAIVTGGAERMEIAIGEASRELAVEQLGGAVPMLSAEVDAGDALIPAIATASQPIRIAIGDSPVLVLPPAAEIGAFVAECGGTGTEPR